MKKRIFKNKQLILLLALAALFILLCLSSSAKPAYASPPSAGPMQLTPGDGGGETPDMIEVYVLNREGGGPVSSVRVSLYYARLAGPIYLESKTTDAYGYVNFTCDEIYNQQDPPIENIWPNCLYDLSVNGYIDDLGHTCYDAHWCQWLGGVATDEYAYASVFVHLEPATVVNVPLAALYSNTAYLQQFAYSTGSSHTLSFQSNVGGNGFMTSQSWTQGITWIAQHNRTAQLGRRYYAVGYYDSTAGNPGIEKAGLSAPVDPQEYFHTMDVPEYLTPDLNKPNYGLPNNSAPISFVIAGDDGLSFYYTETSSFTWSYGYSGSVGVNFVCFGISVKIDTTGTVSSGHTNAITFTVGPLPQATPYHKFVVYTRGFSFTEYNGPSDPNNKGGLELHIWDMGVVT